MRRQRDAKPATTVATLTEEAVKAAIAVVLKVFEDPVPDYWASLWQSEFTRFESQEREARVLVADFSRNREGEAGQWEAVRRFLCSRGVDPENVDDNRDFGNSMDLSPMGRWLVDAYAHAKVQANGLADNGSRPLDIAKRERGEHEAVFEPTWTGFVLHRFSRLETAGFRRRPTP